MSPTQPYTVLRPLCMAGQRVEAGGVVLLTRQQGVELGAAGKVVAGGVVAGSDASKPTRARKLLPAAGAAAAITPPEVATPAAPADLLTPPAP